MKEMGGEGEGEKRGRVERREVGKEKGELLGRGGATSERKCGTEFIAFSVLGE